MSDQKTSGEAGPDPMDRLVKAYETMLQRVHEAAERAEEKTVPWLRETLAQARERAVELGELTREEAERISGYVERDIKEAAHYLTETGREFRDWLRFDAQVIGDRVLEMLGGMAGQTAQALRQLADRAREAATYHTGEVTAPGVLECTACGEHLHFDKTARIPPCPKCKGTRFRRVTE